MKKIIASTVIFIIAMLVVATLVTYILSPATDDVANGNGNESNNAEPKRAIILDENRQVQNCNYKYDGGGGTINFMCKGYTFEPITESDEVCIRLFNEKADDGNLLPKGETACKDSGFYWDTETQGCYYNMLHYNNKIIPTDVSMAYIMISHDDIEKMAQGVETVYYFDNGRDQFVCIKSEYCIKSDAETEIFYQFNVRLNSEKIE